MTLKLSKTAVRELTRLYRGVLIVGLTCLTMTANNAMAAITETDLTNYTLKTATNEQTNQIATVDAITEEIGALLAQKEANISNTLGFDITNNPANTDAPNSLVSQLTGEAAGDSTSVVGAINALDAALTDAKVLAETQADTAETNANAYTDALANGAVATNTANIETNKNNIAANAAGIAENKSAIDVLNGNASTEGSVAKTVADAVSTKQDKLSDAQMNAANSGITADKVTKYEAYEAEIDAKANADTVYTKTEVDTKLDTKADATEVAVHATSIAANTAAITQNTSEINANKTAISTNAAGIAALEAGKADATDVAANTASIAANTAAITQNTSEINANKTAISANAAGIAALEVGKANVADVYTKSEINAQITETKADASAKANAAEANAKSYTDALANGAVKNNTDNIAANAQAIAANATDIAANKTALEVLNGDINTDGSVAQQVNTALTEAKDYTDAQITETKAYVDEKDAATLASAKTYAEEKANTAEANAKSYTDTLIGTTDVLVEQNGVMAVNTVNENIAALNNTIGDITDLNQYAEGSSIGNALTQGGTQSADTIVAALNNVDATLGTIHGLRDKLATSGAGTNLASGTTVEQHLTALDGAIGNRSYTSTRYISSGSDLSSAVSALDSNLSRVEGNLDALTTRTNKMHHEMKSGFASLAAMSALVPNARVAGDTQLSMGAGHYRGTTGFALGAFHHVNDNVLLNAGAAYAGNGSATFKGGVTFGW